MSDITYEELTHNGINFPYLAFSLSDITYEELTLDTALACQFCALLFIQSDITYEELTHFDITIYANSKVINLSDITYEELTPISRNFQLEFVQ